MRLLCTIKVLASLVLLCSNLTLASGQTDEPESLKPIIESIQQKINTGEAASISIGVAKAGKPFYVASFGWADKEQQKEASSTTIYPLGSLSKSITATGLMHLVQQGKVGLEDEANAYLPKPGLQSFVGDPSEVKVWHILNMAAGIPHGWITQEVALGYPTTANEKETYLEKIGLITLPPGKVSHYSNYSYGIAEMLIEKASGQLIDDFMEEALFDPLGMDQSLTQYDAKRATDIASLYDTNGEEIAPYHFIPFGGAGYYGSVEDLLKYGNFHLQLANSKFPKVLDGKHLDLMHNFDEGPMPFFGFGWLNTGHSLISNGNITGANSNITLIPSEDMVIVCLINSSSYSSLADQLTDQIMNALLPNLEKKMDMAYFMKHFQTPYQPKQGLIGEWEGAVELETGSTPVHMNFKANGEIDFQIAKQATVSLSNVTLLPSGKFEGMGRGRIGVPEFSMDSSVPIAIALQWEGDQLYGHLAPRFSTTEGGRCYGAFVAFSKKK